MVPPDSPDPGRDGSSHPGPSANGPGDRSSATAAFSRHVARVTDRFDDLLPFAVVPFVLSLLEVGSVRRALDPPPGGFSINVEFTFPTPLLDLWSFVDPPEPAAGAPTPPSSVGPGGETLGGDPTPGSTGGTDVTIETPFETVVVPLQGGDASLLAWLGLALVLYAVVAAVIAAGYLGGIDRRLRGEPAGILECIVAYAPRLFLYHLVLFGAFLVFVPFFVIAPPLVLLAFPAVIVLGYLFYGVPFLFVVDDAGFLEGFRKSYAFALEGGSYAWFALGHVVVVAVTSLVLSILLNAGVIGFLLGLVVATPLALVLTAATVSFVQELVGTGGRESTTDRPSTGPTAGGDAGSVR